ncbi:MAG: peptidyl-prolyl cis-trans isomerase [Tannerellaceae bacterium]|nr:peptidyl-prolyl cis-trans isomerase [Tannerellaceae bacterium]
MRYSFFSLVAFAVLLGACKHTPSLQTEVLAKVKDRTLNRAGVERIIPKGISSTDSLLIAENYIKKWVKDALVYEVALRNLGDDAAEINQLVEEYRNSLFRYRYQERLIKEKLSADIRITDRINYYEENQKKFILDKGLIKGLFLKIPINAPGLTDVKTWYKSSSVESLEKIEKYSVQNAIFYDYFYDRWVDFDDVMANIPIHISNTNNFLRNNKTVELSDSNYCYLLNIKEYLPMGSVAPYEYAEPQVVEMLINQRKMEFLRNFENELYQDAIKRGDVVLSVEEEVEDES